MPAKLRRQKQMNLVRMYTYVRTFVNIFRYGTLFLFIQTLYGTSVPNILYHSVFSFLAS